MKNYNNFLNKVKNYPIEDLNNLNITEENKEKLIRLDVIAYRSVWVPKGKYSKKIRGFCEHLNEAKELIKDLVSDGVSAVNYYKELMVSETERIALARK